MKTFFYFIAIVLMVGTLSIYGATKSEASSVINELQRRNVEVMSGDTPDILYVRCADGVIIATQKLYHKCIGDGYVEGVGYVPRCQAVNGLGTMVLKYCYLIPNPDLE